MTSPEPESHTQDIGLSSDLSDIDFASTERDRVLKVIQDPEFRPLLNAIVQEFDRRAEELESRQASPSFFHRVFGVKDEVSNVFIPDQLDRYLSEEQRHGLTAKVVNLCEQGVLEQRSHLHASPYYTFVDYSVPEESLECFRDLIGLNHQQ